MRIILWLAAGMGMAAIATAAPARPGGGGHGPGHGPGHGHGLQTGWSNGGGHHGAKGGGTRVGIGRIEIERPHRRHHRRWGGWNGFNPYAGIGIAGPVGEVDPYGNGFFNGSGGRISLRGGQPYFDYDRSYPYEWASAARAREPEAAEAPRRAEAQPRCTFEAGVRVCRGW